MNKILAKRYAKALLSLGADEGLHREYGIELADFAEALGRTAELGASLHSPVYPKEFRGRVLDQVLSKSGLRPILNNFIRLLHDRDRLGALGEIAEAYR